MERNPIDLKTFNPDIFRVFGDDWMLLTVGTLSKLNPMTIGWGFFGTFWSRPIAIVGVRPQRYTFEILQDSDSFTLTAFPPEMRKALSYCGSHSGRDGDKVAACGLTSIASKTVSAPGFDEASVIVECRILYKDFLKKEHFVDSELIDEIYPGADFHEVVWGEVRHVEEAA
jgi:flavin reductase (DIM6/NTAB) family NADH-FMN oxidoreductase RutF